MGDLGRAMNFQPIAPRPNSLGNGRGGDMPPGGASGAPEEGKVKRASTACKECQKRRTRCTGMPGMPCSECTAHGRECITDETSDKRRKASAKKTQEDLKNTQETLEQILSVLRLSDPPAMQHFIQTVRNGASIPDIGATAQQILAALPHTQPSEHLNPQSAQNPHHGMDPNMMDPNMRNYFDASPQ